VCARRAVLVVYSLSRLARSVRDTLEIAERLDKAGADLVSLTEQLDTTTASGKMLFRLLAVLAEFERDLVSERTRTALRYKQARSERVGQIPYGFRLAADGITLEVDAVELGTLAEVHRLRSAGRSLRAIAAELTRRQVPTKNGGPRWSHTSVASILEQETSRETHVSEPAA
jgi:site-specific DNA recombinase